MSNGSGNGGGPRPPEVDKVEISFIGQNQIKFVGEIEDGAIEIIRDGSLEYFENSKVGDKFEVVFKPL